MTALEAAGIEALIVKGWAAARLYAEPGLRPYGDIDVCVGPTRHRAAREALAASLPSVDVDLHRGLAVNSRMIADLPTFETAWGRASRARLEETEIHVLAPEDHLALLCVHLLTHGAWRPLWLCDVAAALERLSDDFDWERCLGRSPRLATWVRSTVALAERLLGAETKHAPTTRGRAPRWLEPAVVRQWASPPTHYPGTLMGLSTSAYFRPSRAVRTSARTGSTRSRPRCCRRPRSTGCRGFRSSSATWPGRRGDSCGARARGGCVTRHPRA